MNSTGFFVWVFTGIEQPIVGVVQAIIGSLSAYAAPILRVAIVAYVIGRMILMAYAPQGAPLNVFMLTLLKCGIAYWVVASAANYNQYLGTILLTTLPTEISHAVSGGMGHALSAQSFDDIWNKAWTGGLVVFKALPFSFKAIALGGAIILYWIASLLGIAIGFTIYLLSYVALAILIAVGILFAALFPFPATRQYFNGWISTTLAMILLQIFVVTLLTIITGAENTLMAQISSGGMGGLNGNEIDQLKMLLGAMLLFVVSGILAWQLPGLAAGCSRGVCADVGAIGSAAWGGLGTVGAGAGWAGRGVGAMASASVTSIGSMSGGGSVAQPSGPSLSGNP